MIKSVIVPFIVIVIPVIVVVVVVIFTICCKSKSSSNDSNNNTNYANNDDDGNGNNNDNVSDVWHIYLPYLYSFISFIGVLLLLCKYLTDFCTVIVSDLSG